MKRQKQTVPNLIAAAVRPDRRRLGRITLFKADNRGGTVVKRRARYYEGAMLVVAGLALAACSVEEKANIRAPMFSPTKYTSRPWINMSLDTRTTGYRDSKIDERNYKVEAIGNEVTSKEHVEKMVLYRAAEIGSENGFSSYIVTSKQTGAWCGAHTGNPQVRTEVRYFKEGERPENGEIRVVEQVLRELQHDVHYPASSTEAKKEAYIANIASCRGGLSGS